MANMFAWISDQFYQSFIEADRWKRYFVGLGVSIYVTIGALFLGIIIGLLVAIVRSYNDQARKVGFGFRILNWFCKIYTTVIRGTPMMVQLLIMGLVIFASSRNLSMIAILTLGINSGAYVSEIIRGGLMSVDIGQMEAGRSLGLKYSTVMKSIIIPQAFKNILPSLGNEFITLFKDTSLVTVIGLTDLTKAAMQIQAKTYQGFFPFIAIAIIYLVVVMLMTWGLGIIEKRMRRSDRK